MTTIVWVLLPILIALGSALIAVGMCERRLELQLARARQSLTAARTVIEDQKNKDEEKHRLPSEEAQQRDLDNWLADVRCELQYFVRDEEEGSATRKWLVVKERLYLRNIPLSDWRKHEAPLEEGVQVEDLAKTLSVFSSNQSSPKTVQRATHGPRPELFGKKLDVNA